MAKPLFIQLLWVLFRLYLKWVFLFCGDRFFDVAFEI